MLRKMIETVWYWLLTIVWPNTYRPRDYVRKHGNGISSLDITLRLAIERQKQHYASIASSAYEMTYASGLAN